MSQGGVFVGWVRLSRALGESPNTMQPRGSGAGAQSLLGMFCRRFLRSRAGVGHVEQRSQETAVGHYSQLWRSLGARCGFQMPESRAFLRDGSELRVGQESRGG